MQSSSDWSPQSWRSKPVGQDIAYPTPSASSSSGTSATEPDPVLYKRKEGLEGVTRKLEQLPPLVSAVEVRSPAPPRLRSRPPNPAGAYGLTDVLYGDRLSDSRPTSPMSPPARRSCCKEETALVRRRLPMPAQIDERRLADCMSPPAELFDYCTSEKIEHRLSLLLSMSLILICASRHHPPLPL